MNYNTHNWLLLQKQLKFNFNVIPVNNRAQILNDALELAALNRLDYSIALGMTKYLVDERDYVPWAACLQSFEGIKIITANTHYREVYKVISNMLIYFAEQISPSLPR